MNKPREVRRKPRTWKERWASFQWNSTSGFLPYFLYAAVLGIVYIANTHYAERNIHRINKLQSEVEELRTDYTTLKAEYMMLGKRSEVAKKASQLGILETDKPVFKVVVKEEEE